MKNLKHFYLYLFIGLLLFNCNKNENFNTPKNQGPRTADDVRTDFSNLDINPGINDITLESNIENVFWNFRIIVPQNASNTNKKPLIFSLHGGAQNYLPDAHKSTDCLITPGIEGIIDAFVVSPNSNGKLWYDPANQSQILALYDLMTSYLPIDTSKIAITGYSDGGNGSWFYSQYFPSLFSAAIPMATSYNTAKSDGSIEKINIPLYVIHGADDQLFPLATTQEYVNASIAAGSNIQFVVAANLNHYQPCDYVSYLRDAASWLATLWNL